MPGRGSPQRVPRTTPRLHLFPPPFHCTPCCPPEQAGNLVYEYDPTYIEARYEVFDLRVVHGRRRTGFEDSKELPVRRNDLIAGRYQVCVCGRACVPQWQPRHHSLAPLQPSCS